MKTKIIIMLIIICLFLLTCKKYEEGPAFSFRSVKNRMYGQWRVRELLVDNAIDSINPDSEQLTSGDFKMRPLCKWSHILIKQYHQI